MSTDYKPISTAYRQMIKEMTENRTSARIQFYSDINEFLTLHGTFKEIEDREGEEYLVLTTGEEVRLDRIVRIGDKPAPGYDESFFQCDTGK
ncbi:hypothetical protein [Pontibacter sp. H249]|uniref:hypothetical protein n=1 Tax=Pontibacter sp. H249 TaxID=3133420 RepID=UPI0030C232E3